MAEIKEFKNRMIKTAEVLSTQFDTVRAGRANAAVLDQIEVDYYGSPTPIRQIASISSPDARTLLIQPWDGSTLKLIEKATALIRAVSLKNSTDFKTANLKNVAFESFKDDIFDAMAKENPELYRSLVQFINSKSQEE